MRNGYMNKERLARLLIGPHISEKAENAAEKFRHVVFKVLPNATKFEVKNAVEAMFNVKVANVNVLNVKGKKKKSGQRIGRRKDWKKAYVELCEGHDINFAGLERG